MRFRMNILLAADLLNIIFKVTAYVYRAALCRISRIAARLQSNADYANYSL